MTNKKMTKKRKASYLKMTKARLIIGIEGREANISKLEAENKKKAKEFTRLDEIACKIIRVKNNCIVRLIKQNNKVISDKKEQTKYLMSIIKKRGDELVVKDDKILQQQQTIICLKSGCVEVPNTEFDGPNQDCIPCDRLIKKNILNPSDVKCPDCGWSGEVIKTDILTSQWIPKCPVCNLVLILGECPKCKYDWNGELNPPKVDYTKECKDCIFINTKDCWPIIDDGGTCRRFKDKDNDKYTKCTLCKGEGHRPVMCTCEVCHGTGKKVK